MKYQAAIDDLRELVDSLRYNYQVINNANELQVELSKYMSMIRTMDFFNRNIQVIMLKNEELYFILKTFKNSYKGFGEKLKIKESLLEPTKYFTDEEIERMELQCFLNADNVQVSDITTFTLKGVYQVSDDQYMIPKITAKEIIELVYNNFVIYDYEVQRESEKVVINGVEYERAKIYKKSVREIAQAMKNGKYTPTPLSINILDKIDDETHFVFNEEEHTLTLSIKDRNALVDGMHRLYALLECYTEDHDFDQIMQLNIFNMDIVRARGYVYQQAQQNAISSEILEKYNSNNIYSVFATELEKTGSTETNLLKGKVANTKDEVFKLSKVTTYAKLTEAIQDNFELSATNTIERRKAKVFLVKFYNELFSILEDKLKDITEDRKNSIALHPNSIFAYTFMASKLKDREAWEDDLSIIMDALDLSSTGELAHFIRPNSYNISSRDKSLLYRFLERYMPVACNRVE